MSCTCPGPNWPAINGRSRVGGPDARLNENVASRLPLFGTVVVLNQTVGMISFGPDRDLEEHHLLEIHIGTGQHDVPGGAADFHPPFPLAGKVGRRFLRAKMTMHPPKSLQGGDHPLALRLGCPASADAANPSARRAMSWADWERSRVVR